MKRLGIALGLGIVVIIGIAVATAGKMGTTSQAYARGKVVLADELKDKARGINTLFLVVGYPDRPMPYGALRKTLPDDKSGELYEFVLTMDNLQRMQEMQPWPESFKIKARLDGDGQAGADQPGDLVGEVTGLSPGAEGVMVTIDRVVP